MDTRRLINGLLLAAVCIMCGCKTCTPGGGLLRVHCFDHRKSGRSWIRRQYFDLHRYTYHETCWRPMMYDACCWKPGMPAEYVEQDQSMIREEVIKGVPDASALYPAAAPAVPTAHPQPRDVDRLSPPLHGPPMNGPLENEESQTPSWQKNTPAGHFQTKNRKPAYEDFVAWSTENARPRVGMKRPPPATLRR